MDYITIGLLLFVVIILLFFMKVRESFVDSYSIYYHIDASKKEKRWNELGRNYDFYIY